VAVTAGRYTDGMTPPPAEPRNWFFTLLVPVSVVFVVTAVAVAVVPVLEQKAVEAGSPPPPSAFRDALRRDGWVWLLVELGVVVVLSVAAMIWDRFQQ
jgi:hypothetical protein